MRIAKSSYWLLALLLVALGSVAAEAKPAAELRALKRPVIAANFHLRDLHGKVVSLHDYRGKVVLLNFWATWCPPCRKEMPSMERLYQAYKGKGLEVVAVSVDTTSSDEVSAFLDQLGLTFTALHDRDSQVTRLYSNPGVPSSYLIDPQGRVAYRVLGGYDWFGEPAKSVVEGLLPAAKR